MSKEKRHIYQDTEEASGQLYYFMHPSDVAERHALFPNKPERYRHVASVEKVGTAVDSDGRSIRVMRSRSGDTFHVFSDHSAILA